MMPIDVGVVLLTDGLIFLPCSCWMDGSLSFSRIDGWIGLLSPSVTCPKSHHDGKMKEGTTLQRA